jgi:hypothetical protein
MYVDDMKVWVGPMSTDPSFSQGDWMGAMISYYGNATKVLYCPSAPDDGNPTKAGNPPGRSDLAWHWTISNPTYASSYGYNCWLIGGLGNAVAHPDYPFKDETAIQYSASTPMFMDSMWINFDPLEHDRPATPKSSGVYDLYDGDMNPEGMPRITIARHGGRPAGSAPKSMLMTHAPLPGTIIIGFVDGHAEPVKIEELWGNYFWHRNWVPGPRPL